MKRAIVIFDSQFGNTKKIAKALALGIEKQGIFVDCIKTDKIETNKLAEYDLLAFGGPTHMLGLSEQMKKFLKDIENVDFKGKKGFCFDTRVKSRFNKFDLNSAAKRIEKKMKKMNIKIIEPRQSAIVVGREGPLEETEELCFIQIGLELALK